MDVYIFLIYALVLIIAFLVTYICYLTSIPKDNKPYFDSAFVDDFLGFMLQSEINQNKYSKLISVYRHDVNGILQIVNFGTSVLSRESKDLGNEKVNDSIQRIKNSVERITKLSSSTKTSELGLCGIDLLLGDIISRSIDESGSPDNHKLTNNDACSIRINHTREFILRSFLAFLLRDLSQNDCEGQNININYALEGKFAKITFNFETNVCFKNLQQLYLNASQGLKLLGFDILMQEKKNRLIIKFSFLDS